MLQLACGARVFVNANAPNSVSFSGLLFFLYLPVCTRVHGQDNVFGLKLDLVHTHA